MMRITLGLDHLSAAVANDLASRYCPVDRAVFLARLGVLVAACFGVALSLFVIGKLKARTTRRKELAVIAACAVGLFAVGGGALVLFGLSGCTGGTEAGLTWDWPW